MKRRSPGAFFYWFKNRAGGNDTRKGVENMRLLGLIFLIAAVVFILLGVFLKLAAFFFVSMLTLIAALVLFMILKKNQHNQT